MSSIRQATSADTAFIARMILVALHIDPDTKPAVRRHMEQLVADPDTLYSWQRCVIAIDEGQEAGLCLAYDGSDYHQRRLRSFSQPWDTDDADATVAPDALQKQEDETHQGEYYIDSLAVMPSHRRRGIARLLLQHAIDTATANGLQPTLVVDPANPDALRLYTSMGFKYKREMFVFGQIYHKYVHQ